MNTIIIWPILVASVVAFAIGALWYSPVLFGKEYMSLMKISDKEVAAAKAKGGMWKLYVVQFITTVVMFGVLAFLIYASGTSNAKNGAFLGVLVWLGFPAMFDIGSLLWEKKPFKLVVIQSVVMLINLVIGGAVLGAWH